ncbi:MAG TPA: type II toxin-antitoxin system Phd/YefM family antitoxin [Frankiaceae bacterium]|nr:type II toxin-antitoxin system Phd/YefM family antitoxin [Frankiaceae bacterium]
MEALPLTDVKSRLSALVERVDRTHDRVTITRNGRPAAVLISTDDLESLEETLDVLSDPETVARVRAARLEIETVTEDELVEAMRARGRL